MLWCVWRDVCVLLRCAPKKFDAPQRVRFSPVGFKLTYPLLTFLTQVADVGCGFGGLLFGLAEHPATQHLVCLGLEIRTKVTEYVRLKIEAERKEKPGMVRV